MHILIGGDIFISDRYRNHTLLDPSVVDLFRQADYRIVNLEAPLTPDDPKNKINKTGPHLRSSDATVIPYLKQLNIDMVTLANNHILDYGGNGLSDTFKALSNGHIAYVGAGDNLHEAAKPLTIERNGLKLAMLNFAEKEWSIAGRNSPGANPLDIIDNVNQIKKAKAFHDKVICIIHGGHENYSLPSPRMVKQYRFYADNGADAIIGHHTHCVSGYEVYKETPIAYSLGNMLFTKKVNNQAWYYGVVVKLELEKNKPIEIDLYPVTQDRELFKLKSVTGKDLQNMLLEIGAFNNIIYDKHALQCRWDQFVLRNRTSINFISPVSAIPFRFILSLLCKLRITTKLISKKQRIILLNKTRCQSHRDILLSVLNETS